ncbi:uncharacterized protein TNCT_459251 [Trichonephila clavata]|uniref:Uncharacterized protein n=1 Tax=Trichonephila clavata TaxID=2740835 RepID=A0A8X6M350_TRICU|nr:uncharacterized protein TNCT_459251 [Trichonephila clavata]
MSVELSESTTNEAMNNQERMGMRGCPVTYLKSELEVQSKFPLYQPADLEKLKVELASGEKEYQTILGKNKRTDTKEFQLSRKGARTIKEIPIDQVVCTTKHNFSVLEDEQPTVDMSDLPIPSPPKIKPIMMKITKNYNLIIREINRKYPATVNEATGDWIKSQCATSDDHRDITTSLVEKKIEHWVVDPIANRPIKVVFKDLPASITVAEIEHDLKEKEVAVEKVAQLRKF